MRIHDMRPERTPHRDDGRTRKLSSWSYHDGTDRDGTIRRTIWHYSTRMVVFTSTDNGATWTADVVSSGHGSVSDQNGVNLLTSRRSVWAGKGCETLRDYGWRYSRRGGASVEYVGIDRDVTVAEVVATWPVQMVAS